MRKIIQCLSREDLHLYFSCIIRSDSELSCDNRSITSTSAQINNYDVRRVKNIRALRVVLIHYSLNLCHVVSCIFMLKFPDDEIAQSFTCGSTKWAHLLSFDIYSHVHEVLVDVIRSAQCCVVSFDDA